MNRRNKEMNPVVGLVIFLTIVIGFAYGWMLNLVNFIESPTVLEGFGVFIAPLGAFLGYIN